LVVIQTHIAKSQSSICTTHTFCVGTLYSITLGNFDMSNTGMHYFKIKNLPYL